MLKIQDFLVDKAELLAEGVVDVWQVNLEIAIGRLEKFNRLLSVDEQAQAQRFVFDKDSQHFIVARGSLRQILSYYVDTPPEGIVFHYGEHGKPYLSSKLADHPLQFNFSHSGNVALCVVTKEQQVGIDVEYICKGIEFEQIAKRFFSSRESETLAKLPVAERKQAFFRIWTRKEAFIKAIGAGLSFPLNDFEVSLNPTEAQLVHIKGDIQEADKWQVEDIVLTENYVGAVAIKKKPVKWRFLTVD